MVSIAERLAALRAASVTQKEPEADNFDDSGEWYIHLDIFRAFLENRGRTDVDFLCSRPRDERKAIMDAVERDNQAVMRFL